MGIHRNPGLNQSVLQMVEQYATDVDTGAAVTTVSDKFARYLPDSIQQWNGPNVRLANGQIISPKQGI